VADIVIDHPVQAELARYLPVPRLSADVVAGRIRHLKGFEKQVMLFRRGWLLNLSRQFHGVKFVVFRTEVQAEGGSSLDRKSRVSAAVA
jgi:hypothetical protein